MPGLRERPQQDDPMRSEQTRQDMPSVECVGSATRIMGNCLRYCTAQLIWRIIRCIGTRMNRNYGGCYM
eukprot:8335689-Karenia_brevis.AAC.1